MSKVIYEIHFIKYSKIESNIEFQDLGINVEVMDFNSEFIFGGINKMNFINKIIQLEASFVSTKFVLCNGDIG